MNTIENRALSELEAFLKSHSHITYATPSSPNFVSLREVWNLDTKANPLIIVRPQNAEDVSLLVKYATSHGVRFVVRTGGHNLFGQSVEDGAMTIDMRDIAHVHIQQGNQSAKIGGGILQEKLVGSLHKEGLATAVGAIHSVGFVGWATYGGYGPLSSNFGLGVDQILGAKIVNSNGDIVDANETLLRGIKGAGGNFGIIVELTVKLYPLKSIFAGTLIFESQDIASTIMKLNRGYRQLKNQELPSQLGVQQIVVNSPYGRVLGLNFTWSSDDIATGRTWLSKFEALGTVVMNTVAETTLPKMLSAAQALVPSKVYGHSRTHSLSSITDEILDVIGPVLEKMPSDVGTMFVIHELRGPSATPNKNSIFVSRNPHFMLEIVGTSVELASREMGMDWSKRMWEEINRTDRQNILPGTYISLDPPGESPATFPLSRIYGSYGSDVLDLKRTYDPQNVFEFAVPRLGEYVRG